MAHIFLLKIAQERKLRKEARKGEDETEKNETKRKKERKKLRREGDIENVCVCVIERGREREVGQDEI